METAWIIATTGIAGAICTATGFWFALGGRLAKAEAIAADALQTAAEAEQHVRALEHQFSDYRVEAIEKFVMVDTLNAIKSDLVTAAAQTEQRMIDAIKGVSDRLDKIIGANLKPARGKV